MQRLVQQASIAIATCMAMLLGGCAITDIRKAANAEVERVKTGPEAAPFRTITGFSDGLRCMDNLMIVYGVRDWPILVEELTDHTKKINAGTKDMLISAISDVSKRSRAIRLVTFGTDSGNLANFHANAESKRPYESIPLYDIRGSISQLDEGLFKKQVEGGITFGPVGVGAAKSGDASILALDLTVIAARDYSVVPGVTSRNSVMIYKEGAGVDGEAEYKKLGLNFGMTLTRSEGKAQALRGLVELSVIELVGKLTRTPYWTCLGARPGSEVVAIEVSDWFYAMSANAELVPWTQEQLTIRGHYQGEIDGTINPAFKDALLKYRGVLGLSAEPVIDEAFFSTYLSTNHKEVFYAPNRAKRVGAETAVAAKAETAADPAPRKTANVGPEVAASAPDASAALKLAIALMSPRVKAGEPVELSITPNRDAHMVCYLQDAKAGIQRIYPNRFASTAVVRTSTPLMIPGSPHFQLLAPAAAARETVSCFAANRNLLAELPASVVGRDFEALPVTSLREVREAFVNTVGGKFAQETFHVESK